MQTIIFDGRQEAQKILEGLTPKVVKLRGGGITPKLVSIMVGGNKGSRLYLSIKQKAAEKIGAVVEIVQFTEGTSIEQITRFIKKQNGDGLVHGIMVQLPLPESYSEKNEERILRAIDVRKDVDGMRNTGRFITPVVLAIEKAVKDGLEKLDLKKDGLRIVVLGASGFVGSKTVAYFKHLGFSVFGCDIKIKGSCSERQKADVLISATGQAGLIGKDSVKEGAVVVDVGAPEGDVKTEEVVGKVSYLSPVPGGIGPITVAYLMENLVKAAERFASEERVA